MSSHKTVPVLVADDEPLMRDLLASILRAEGYVNLQFAKDGQQAVELLGAPEPAVALAFLDIDMPGFTGLEVMAMAKTRSPHCFFVIVSAHSGLDNVLAALNGGAQGFIVKPYSGQKIHDILKKFESGVSNEQ